MSLMLRERPDVQTVFNGSISVDRLTWGFWIKAGMGFTFGAALFGAIAGAVTWGTMILGALVWWALRH